MYTHQTGSFYTLYLQNDYYAQKTLENRAAIDKSGGNWALSEPFDKGLDDYLSKIIELIPELKEAEQKGIGIGVEILPESASADLKQGVSLATDKMIKDGTDPDILKSVLGFVKGEWSGDVEMHDGYALSKNDTFSYDTAALKNVMEKFKDAYGTDTALSEAMAKFADYLNEIWGFLNKDAGNNNAGSIFTSLGQLSSEEKKGQFLNTSA
ncbi:MAG: hypothetical protein PHO62_08715 [Sulfurimonas sp.]|uniref:hypothetical protein n=1 Tax=Sulfurimonas sp. TaxID=2022749 RepID=UPI00261CFCF4|nr:hypothetical protein [Sulfurimonas sp.]MDD5373493.1 hypothetical protein [Sulfurimonas sp.]